MLVDGVQSIASRSCILLVDGVQSIASRKCILLIDGVESIASRRCILLVDGVQSIARNHFGASTLFTLLICNLHYASYIHANLYWT